MIEIDPNEQVIKVVHRHWFVLLGRIFMLLFFVALPVLPLFTLHLLPIERILAFHGNPAYAGGFFFFSWMFVVWMVAWNMWMTYYFDIVLITDKRIFDINQRGLFSRESGSFRIDRIQNVTVDQKGVLETLINFGSIRFETAGGNDEDFVATYIARPYEIKKLINEMQDGTLDKTQEVHLHSSTIDRLAHLTDTPEEVSSPDYRGGKIGDSEGI